MNKDNQFDNLQPEHLYEWQGDGCDDCSQYNGNTYRLDQAPTTHPNCKCELVPTGNRAETGFSAGNLYKAREAIVKAFDKALIERVKARLLEEEGKEKQIYLDTKGNKTVGIGENVDNKATFMKVNWQVNGRPATEAEKLEAFNVFEALAKKGNFGQSLTADWFKDKNNLYITEQEIARLLDEHLRNDLQKLKEGVPNFDSLPPQMKEVILDIRFNTGNFSRSNWPNLYNAIEAKDTAWAARETHRKDVGQKRNEWARERVNSIEKW